MREWSLLIVAGGLLTVLTAVLLWIDRKWAQTGPEPTEDDRNCPDLCPNRCKQWPFCSMGDE